MDPHQTPKLFDALSLDVDFLVFKQMPGPHSQDHSIC